MNSSILDTIRTHCRRLEPLATDVAPKFEPLRGIRAALFDVYGTLFISASGDVGTATAEGRAAALEDALRAVGIRCAPSDRADSRQMVQRAADRLVTTIEASHETARANGIEYPEVDILSIWQTTIQSLTGDGTLSRPPGAIDWHRLAVEYEVRTNPTWPMPGAAECLQQLAQQGTLLGIVSNAQFFTPALFPALLGTPAEQLGFDAHLQFYSYRFEWAKPGLRLFEKAVEALSQRAVRPCEVVYIGNDLLNDVMAAGQVGFRTALFAGDARSLRMRRGDPRVEGVVPDVVLTDLTQLIHCLGDTASRDEG